MNSVWQTNPKVSLKFLFLVSAPDAPPAPGLVEALFSDHRSVLRDSPHSNTREKENCKIGNLKMTE